MKISFVDNNVIQGKAFLKRDNSIVDEWIINHQDTFAFCHSAGNSIYAFDISKNESLSKIYRGDFFVVRFVLKDVDTFHDPKQEDIFRNMFQQLEQYMEQNPGYYNLRLPTHLVDILRAYNSEQKEVFFCGGTVEWITENKLIDIKEKEGMSVFVADDAYIEKNRKRLLEIAYEAFRQYHGQYHISPVTSEKAGEIYKEWLKGSLENYEGNVIVAVVDKMPIAYVLRNETETSIEFAIGGVDAHYQKYGAYRAMISSTINYATKKNKIFVTSTQFDNYIVQGVWSSLGLKPFYSIYNIHIDRRL